MKRKIGGRARKVTPPSVRKKGKTCKKILARECDCDGLQCPVFKNFRTACNHYNFPGSYQVGSYGPKGQGIVRTYSNATPGKDKVLDDGQVVLYRLKDERTRDQFKVNIARKKPVRVFRKISAGVMDLGPFLVYGFVGADVEADQVAKFGPEFVHFVRTGGPEVRIGLRYNLAA